MCMTSVHVSCTVYIRWCVISEALQAMNARGNYAPHLATPITHCLSNTHPNNNKVEFY